MEAAEVPVFEEHATPPQQAGAEEAVAAHQPPVGTPPGAGLALALPPSTAAAAEGAAAAGDPPRRWSLDLASSTHSDWELLSAGHDSHCGSSPRSVSPSDAYDSEGEAAEARAEAEAEAGAEAAAEHAAPQLDAGSTAELGEATAAAAAAAEDASAEPEVGPEGVPTAQLVLAPAAMAEAPGTDIDSPRSSYERTSSLASGHDLYSLSQDGSADSLTEDDDYIGGMMLRGEPDRPAGVEAAEPGVHSGSEDEARGPGGGGGGGKPRRAELQPLACAPAAALAAAARGAYCAASRHLHELAASVSAVLAGMVPAAADVARHVMRGVADMVDTLRERMAALPQGLSSLAAAMNPAAAAAAGHMQEAAQRARKQLGYRSINWAKVALLLGVTCGGLALALYRSRTEQARLTLALARREADLSRLLSKVMELQRNITQRHHPLIRHVAASPPTPFWPAVIVV